MNEREELPVVIARLLVALLPIAVFLYVQHEYEVDRVLDQVRYRLELLSWRWRVWRRLGPEQRERYIELHGAPE